jgi:hypothetical protein
MTRYVEYAHYSWVTFGSHLQNLLTQVYTCGIVMLAPKV